MDEWVPFLLVIAACGLALSIVFYAPDLPMWRMR